MSNEAPALMRLSHYDNKPPSLERTRCRRVLWFFWYYAGASWRRHLQGRWLADNKRNAAPFASYWCWLFHHRREKRCRGRAARGSFRMLLPTCRSLALVPIARVIYCCRWRLRRWWPFDDLLIHAADASPRQMISYARWYHEKCFRPFKTSRSIIMSCP